MPEIKVFKGFEPKREVVTDWKPMEVEDVIETGKKHFFQNIEDEGMPLCPGNFKVVEVLDDLHLQVRGVCTTPECGVEEIIGE